MRSVLSNVSNSRLSARGRHHEIALSRDESFFKILRKLFPPAPFRFLAFFFNVPAVEYSLSPNAYNSVISKGDGNLPRHIYRKDCAELAE